MDHFSGKETDLSAVWWLNGSEVNMGKNGLVRLVLRDDGSGPMGQYDRIHCFYEDGRYCVYMAHHIEGYLVAGKTEIR